MKIFDLLIAILWAFWALYWFVSAIGTKRNLRNDNWWVGIVLRVVIIIAVLSFLHIPLLYHFAQNIHSKSFYTNPFIVFIGFLIFLAGLFVSVWARLSLGKNWGMPMTTKEKSELVTTGPYEYIRHPIYTGMIAAMLGTTIATTIFWLIPFFLSPHILYSVQNLRKKIC
jgi:protein-S-isoprenylcysteine O-methyltransferase Ste14